MHDRGVRLDVSSLTHNGQTFPGPVFDVPPDTAAALLARPASFRAATGDDLEDTGAAAPDGEPKPRRRKATG